MNKVGVFLIIDVFYHIFYNKASDPDIWVNIPAVLKASDNFVNTTVYNKLITNPDFQIFAFES